MKRLKTFKKWLQRKKIGSSLRKLVKNFRICIKMMITMKMMHGPLRKDLRPVPIRFEASFNAAHTASHIGPYMRQATKCFWVCNN